MLNFTHSVPTTVYFGRGQVKAIEGELRKRAKKILIVTGGGSVKRNGVFRDVIKSVKKSKTPFTELSGIKPNPRLKSVYEGIKICKREKADFILAVGGGSVIDASKAIACGVKYRADVWDFFTKVTKPVEALPVGVVLTLAATGSEMNGNTVITREDTKRKLAFGSPVIKPVFSVLDPEYTYTVDKYNTAAGVVDIMTHIFEQYFSRTKAAEVQDRIAEGLLKVCVKYGSAVCENPRDYNARANILWAGSIALNGLIGKGKEEDWASHAIEHELSAIYDISHGAGLSIVVPNWMRHVLSAGTVKKFFDYGVNVWGVEKNRSDMKIAADAINKTRLFFNSLGMPSNLRDAGIGKENFKKMADSAVRDWPQVGHFKKLSAKNIIKILQASV